MRDALDNTVTCAAAGTIIKELDKLISHNVKICPFDDGTARFLDRAINECEDYKWVTIPRGQAEHLMYMTTCCLVLFTAHYANTWLRQRRLRPDMPADTLRRFSAQSAALVAFASPVSSWLGDKSVKTVPIKKIISTMESAGLPENFATNIASSVVAVPADYLIKNCRQIWQNVDNRVRQSTLLRASQEQAMAATYTPLSPPAHTPTIVQPHRGQAPNQ
jgi:hypothetical protein